MTGFFRRAAVIVDANKGSESHKPDGILGDIHLQAVTVRMNPIIDEVGMVFATRLAALLLTAIMFWAEPAEAQQRSARSDRYGAEELSRAGHRFFGNVSRELASVIERAVSQWGLPNGYVLGEEGSGAFVAGLRYGEGTLYTKNAGDLKVYWQGPSVGFDWGGDGARTMILVYNLPATEAIYQRFGGIDGSAYVIGGFGMTALTANNIVLVPIRSGLGLRLGANIGYLKFTPQPTWNPF
jgi:hypothetical protein